MSTYDKRTESAKNSTYKDWYKGNGEANIKSTVITDKLRVSSAIMRRQDWWGDWDLIETWVFSDDDIHSSRQIFSKSPDKAILVHDLIVGILKN